MSIRALSASDFDSWLPLWQGYQRFYKTDIPGPVTEVTFARLVDPAEPMFCALVEHDGVAVGLVHYIFHRSTWTTGNYVYLQDLFVQDGLRGHGLGRQLIHHVYDTARAAGASRVHWLTHETNTDAMHLYDQVADRSGFVQYRQLLG
jgi:GNAT superfamily N-acetyltransferase